VLDVSTLTACDSQGVAILFRLASLTRDAGGWLTITHPRGIVRRIFDLTRVVDAVTIVDDAY